MGDEEEAVKASEAEVSRQEDAIVPFEKVAAMDDKGGDEMRADGSVARDVVLARVETEKMLCLIKAWEESEKSKVENKAQMRLSAIRSWENSKTAKIEAELKTIEEELQRKKAECIEKMQNRVALLHREAEEKRAVVEAKRGVEILKAEETAAKHRSAGTVPPKKFLGIFTT